MNMSTPVPSRLRPRPRLRSQATRALAIALTLAMVAEPLTAAAMGPAGPTFGDGDRNEARTLTEQGQAAFDAGDYSGAASSWRRILDVLPESSVNRAERENALLITLEAYKHGYRQAKAVNGRATQSDVAALRQGLTLCRDYAEEVTRVHGQQATVGASVFESRAEIEAMLAEAGAGEADPGPPVFTPVEGPQLERSMVSRGPTGTALIAIGATTIVIGLAMIPLIVIGAKERKEADRELDAAEEAMDGPATAAAEDHRRSANAMLISGSVLTGVLTAGGATMLGIGIRRRVRYMAVAPSIGPAYVGIGVRGRF
jgi:hypothetical protein